MFCPNILSVGKEFYKNAIPDVPLKEKRSRTAFTTEQLNYLEREYKTCPYSEHDRLCKIANIIRKPEKVVKIWFQNRRSRERKSNKQSVAEKSKQEISGTKKLISAPVSNIYTSNKPTYNAPVIQMNYNNPFCQMPQVQNITSQTNQLNRIKDVNANKQAVNLHKIINNVKKVKYPTLNPEKCKDKTTKTKNKVYSPKGNINEQANTRICNAHPKTDKIPEYNFSFNNSNLPNSSNFFITSNNSAINFIPNELPGFPSKHVGQKNFNREELKQEKNISHNIMLQKQETSKSQNKCNCNCITKSKQSGMQKMQNSQIPYVIIIPCLK